MRTGLLLFLAAGLPHAAILRGTVVEAQTGKALAGALVVLEPVTGTPGEPASVRTSVYGTFEFSRLAGGSYLITASRRGFAPVHYGQRRWKAAGIPITLEPAGSALISVALPRYGAISGFVLDENDVGLPEHEVVAYRATQPPQLAARAQADDRGRYRLSGLEPGVNDLAMERRIVMHGAAYVSPRTVSMLGRLGRSWGCPALPTGVHRRVIDLIKGGSAVFAYYPDPRWLRQSRFLSCSVMRVASR